MNWHGRNERGVERERRRKGEEKRNGIGVLG